VYPFDDLPPALRPGRIQTRVVTIAPDGGLTVHGGDMPRGLAAAIGSFDGVHLGHQHVIESALAAGRAKDVQTAVICFDPHPQSFFRPASAPFRLMRLSQQVRAFEALGVDCALVVRFDGNLSNLSAEAFAQKVLHEGLGVSHVSAGYDFQFGKRGGGHASDLVALGERFGFTTDILPLQMDAEGDKLSSSSVREALLAGDAARAAHILGAPQAYVGRVQHGAKLGRTIDFPTLNIHLGEYLRPRYGIYVTQTRLGDGRVVNGVSNIGVRPTVGGEIELLETFLFDFNEDLYGQMVETLLLDFIRPEAKFDSFDAMKAEIQNDAAKARAWFAGR
jgi:riboflavin kinase/FMN adenylyltransferase